MPAGWPIGPYPHVVERTFKLQGFPGKETFGWDEMTPQQQMAQLAKSMTRLRVAAAARKQDSDWPLQYGGAAAQSPVQSLRTPCAAPGSRLQ